MTLENEIILDLTVLSILAIPFIIKLDPFFLFILYLTIFVYMLKLVKYLIKRFKKYYYIKLEEKELNNYLKKYGV